MGISSKKQDIFTKEELSKEIIPRLSRGRYYLDISDSGEVKVSSVANRWVQREDIVQVEP